MKNVLEVQRFLETHTFGELYEKWGVGARASRTGHKFSLNYDQLTWTPGHAPTEQCRGLVLALSDTNVKIPMTENEKPDLGFCPGKTEVYAYPMDKFYNSEEIHAAKIDWHDPNLLVEDKLDGTLCILYWDTLMSQWCVATRSVPDAILPLDYWEKISFKSLFEDAVRQTTSLTFDAFCNSLSKENTYCFELTSPYNRILVDYKKHGITLLSVRNNTTFIEQNRLDAQRSNNVLALVPVPKTWNLNSYNEIKEFVNELSPNECEGAIVVDSRFQRIKIKNIKWVVANATKTTICASPRNIVKYIIRGIDDDIKEMLPVDIQNYLDDMRTAMRQLFDETDANFAKWRSEATSRKNFAEIVNLNSFNNWNGPYFKLYEGKFNSTWEYVQCLLKSDRLSNAFIDSILKHVKVRPYATRDQETVSG